MTAPTLNAFLPQLLHRAAAQMDGELEAVLRPHGLSRISWVVLTALIEDGTGTVSGLARIASTQQPTMTKMLDRMVKDGLVKRLPDALDRRVVRIAITPRGSELLAPASAAIAGFHAELPRCLTEELLLLSSIIERGARQRRRPRQDGAA